MDKKTLIIVGTSLIAVFVILIVVLWLITVFKPRYYNYETVEQKIIDATEKYYKNNPEALPSANGKYSLQYDALVQAEYIKPLNELLVDGNQCNAEIIVIKKDNEYSYVPKLNCGENYESIELYKKIKNDNKVTTTGSGLYYDEINNVYYFRGKISNNYVALGTTEKRKGDVDNLWRIISIESDNTIRMKSELHFEEKTIFDDRFNIIKEKNVGYNDFKMSVLKDFLVDLEKKDDLLTPVQKLKLVSKKVCAGNRALDDKSKDGSSECSIMTDEEMLYSTMMPYEYMRASLDENCIDITSGSCENFNFLANETTSSEWSTIGSSEDNYHVYAFNGYAFNPTSAQTIRSIYPTVYVSELSFYKSGSGTKEDPYRLFPKTSKK